MCESPEEDRMKWGELSPRLAERIVLHELERTEKFLKFWDRFYMDAPRTFRERWFSWPWRPWIKIKRVLKPLPPASGKTIKFRRYKLPESPQPDFEI